MLTTKMILEQLSPVNRATFLTKCLNLNGYDPLSFKDLFDAFRTSELTTNSDCPKYKKTTSFSKSGFLRNLRPELLAVILPVASNPSALRMIHGSMIEGFNTKSSFDQINPYYWPMTEAMVTASAETFEDIMGMDIDDLVSDGLKREYNLSPKVIDEPTIEVVQELVQELVQKPEAIALNKDLLPIANSALSQATYGKHDNLDTLLKSHDSQAGYIQELRAQIDGLGKIANVIETDGPGGGPGGQAQRCGGVHDLRIMVSPPGQHRRQLQLLPQVEVVVGRRTVGGNPHRDSGGEHLDNRSNAGAELEV